MKNLYVLLAILILLSCSKEAEPTPEELIVGTWRPVKYIEKCLDGEVDEDYPDSCEMKSLFEFDKNGAMRFTFYSLDDYDICASEYVEGTWEITNELLSFMSNDGGEWEEHNYLEIEGNILRIGQYYGDSDESPIPNCFEGDFWYVELERVE